MKSEAFTIVALVLTLVASEVPAIAGTSVTRIIDTKGEVTYKRKGSLKFQPAKRGTELYQGDLLKPTKDAIAIVSCANSSRTKTRIVPAGVESSVTSLCPNSTTPPTGETLQSRGGSDPSIPYVISPRKTDVLDVKPRIRWNATPGASSYTVTVRGLGLAWKTKVDGTEVTYSGEQPLEIGVSYSVVVEADNGESSKKDRVVDIGFKLVDKAEAQLIRSEIQQLTKQELPDEAKALVIADLYAEHNLMSNAIETLESLVNKGSKTAAVYQILGDFYQQVELILLAESRYLKAAELAKTDQAAELQAAVQAKLAGVYAERGNRDLAIRLLKEAHNGYKALGDIEHLREIEKQLVELRKKR